MDNSTVIIMLVAMVAGYIILKLLATKYFIRLYNETGKNMITKPRQLLGFVTGIALIAGIVAIASQEFYGIQIFGIILMLAILLLSMIMANKSVGGKHTAFCTLYQLALGVCFVGRFLVWLLEISWSIGGMICFGGSASFKWHPFFFTIIDENGHVVEKKNANVVMNEDGAFEGSANTATKITEEMNNMRIRQEQTFIEQEIEREKLNLDQAIDEGDSGAFEQQRINELEAQYDHLESQKKKPSAV